MKNHINLKNRIDSTFMSGTAAVESHSGEFFQGGLGKPGDFRRVLCTLPAPIFQAVATVTIVVESSEIVVNGDRSKAKRAARATLDDLGLADCGVIVNAGCNIRPRIGGGSSSAECLAVIRAIASAAAIRLTTSTEAALMRQAEGTVDPIGLDRPTLFAHLEGEIVEEYAAYPPLIVGVLDSDPGSGLDTDSIVRPAYSREELETFDLLSSLMRRAFQIADARLLGKVATASAQINDRYFPKRRFAEALAIAEEGRAAGVAISHSGTIVCPIWNGLDGMNTARCLATLEALEGIGYERLAAYRLGGRR